MAVLGESGVGKSSLVQRYVFNIFTETGPQTGKEEENKTIIFKTGQHVELKICDTQGKEWNLMSNRHFMSTIERLSTSQRLL